MTDTTAAATGVLNKSKPRYRRPGVEREGAAQLTLLETALWPINPFLWPRPAYETTFPYRAPTGPKTASVIVRAPLGLQSFDEMCLWGLLGATMKQFTDGSTLLATPYWILRQLGCQTGGANYEQLRLSLQRLATVSYQCSAFYNPVTKEREQAGFQFLSYLLPTVAGAGESVDTRRAWRIDWNPTFLRFCRASGGNLLFDLDLYRTLSPAARRLYLKLKDRFWRSPRVLLNVDDLTVNGLGFSADRPLAKRKYDLLRVVGELLDRGILELGKGQTAAEQLIFKHSKGVYIVTFYQGPYFTQPFPKPSTSRSGKQEHPLTEPLRALGVDGPGIIRLLRDFSSSRIERWVRIADAAANEAPRGFPGFRTSPAAFLIDGLHNNRPPPDWWHSHEKQRERRQWERDRVSRAETDESAQREYAQARKQALSVFLRTPEGHRLYEENYDHLIVLHRVTDPDRAEESARTAARQRIDRQTLSFPSFTEWQASHRESQAGSLA